MFPTLKTNEEPKLGFVYSVLKTDLHINDDLRTISDKDTSLTVHMLDSVKRNGVLMPITVWYTKDSEGNYCLKIITGNRRVWCANRVKKIEYIDCIFKHCTDHADYMRQAFHSNQHKSSKIHELVKTFKTEVISNGLSPKRVAGAYGVSEKSVYSALKIAGNDKLEDIAKSSFKNAVCLGGNRSFLDNSSIIEVAKTGTIEQLKEAIANARKKAKLAKDKAEGKETPKEVKKFDNERKRLFFTQLENITSKSIDVKSLKDYLYGDTDNWS